MELFVLVGKQPAFIGACRGSNDGGRLLFRGLSTYLVVMTSCRFCFLPSFSPVPAVEDTYIRPTRRASSRHDQIQDTNSSLGVEETEL